MHPRRSSAKQPERLDRRFARAMHSALSARRNFIADLWLPFARPNSRIYGTFSLRFPSLFLGHRRGASLRTRPNGTDVPTDGEIRATRFDYSPLLFRPSVPSALRGTARTGSFIGIALTALLALRSSARYFRLLVAARFPENFCETFDRVERHI